MNGTLRDYVKQRRAELGLTQAELAEKAGVNQPVISDIERGATKMPDADRRRKIARALGVSHVDLLVAAGELTTDELRAAGAEGVIERAPDDPYVEIVTMAQAVNWSAVDTLMREVVRDNIKKVLTHQQNLAAGRSRGEGSPARRAR